MKRKRLPPRSLFISKRSLFISKPAGDADLVSVLNALAANTPNKQMQEAIDTLLQAAAAGETDSNVERGREYARKIRDHIALMQHAIDASDATGAALWAMRATQAWMQLRWDAISAAPHRHHVSRTRNLRGKSKRPDDSEIREVLVSTKGQKAQAAKLDVSVRTLRRWLEEIGTKK